MPRKKDKLHTDDWRKWPRDVKQKLYAQYLAEEAKEKARELESRGWLAWYTQIFGEYFTSNLAPHHCEAIAWHWTAVMEKRAGLKVSKSVYPAIWSRGHRKSDIVRAIVAADACLLSPGYCLYVSCTKGKVRGHAISVESLITHPRLTEYYPQVGVVRRNPEGASKGWTAEFIYCDAGYIFHYIGLDQGVAGANVDNVRPTIIVLDDVDDREDSPLISENRLHTLTRAVLPTGVRNTLVFMAQNYISRHGAIYKIHSGKEILLTNRAITKPIPAVYNLKTEPRLLDDGLIHDVITEGTPSWSAFDIPRAQEEIDRIGLRSFIAECQHDVEADKSGAILPEWDESTHVVHWEEFNARYGLLSGNRECPAHWRRYVCHDWGASEGHACVVVILAVAAQNSPLPGTVYVEKLFSFPAGTVSGQVAHTLLQWVLRHNQSNMRKYIELGLLDRATGDPGDMLAAGARRRVQEELAKLSSYCMWHMGHDHKAVRDVYRMIYGLPFQPCNPKRAGGIEQIRHHLRVDYTEPHPLRPGAMGYARLYALADGTWEGTHPRWYNNDDGLKLLRDQFPEWRWRPAQLTANGMLDERPMKLDDDVGNALMMIFSHFQMAATPLTHDERVVASIPPELRYETLLANSPHDAGLTPEQELAHLFAIRQARRSVRPSITRFDDYGNRITN
jgi:hypothetical protein